MCGSVEVGVLPENAVDEYLAANKVEPSRRLWRLLATATRA